MNILLWFFFMGWAFYISIMWDIIRHPLFSDGFLIKMVTLLLLSMPFVAPYAIARLEKCIEEKVYGT